MDSADDPLRAALPDRIEIQGAKADRLFRQMAAGDLDLVLDVPPPPGHAAPVPSDPELRPLIQTPDGPSSIRFATFNLAMPPFDDLAVRRAVAFALDRASLAAVFRRVDGVPRRSRTISPRTRSRPRSCRGGRCSREVVETVTSGPLGRPSRPLATSRTVAASILRADGIPVLVDERYPAAIPIVRRAFEALGMRADVQLGNLYYSCTDPRVHVGFCVGHGWVAEFPSAEGFIAAFFASDGTYPATRLGARPNQLRRWGYGVRACRAWTPQSLDALRKWGRRNPRAGRASTNMW